MANWSGEWELVVATPDYFDLRDKGPAVGSFWLQESVDADGVYLVKYEPGQMTDAWKGTVLLERGGLPGPTLPAVLSVPLAANDALTKAKALKAVLKNSWLAHNKRVTCLEGDVSIQGLKVGVVLFKVDSGLANGKAFLVVLMRDDLNKQNSPDGAAGGRQR